MKKEDTVKLISAEGFEFVLDKEAAMVSQTIHNMLTCPGSFAERQRGEVTYSAFLCVSVGCGTTRVVDEIKATRSRDDSKLEACGSENVRQINEEKDGRELLEALKDSSLSSVLSPLSLFTVIVAIINRAPSGLFLPAVVRPIRNPIKLPIKCNNFNALTHLADVWSCGVTLYVMLLGAYPFEDHADPRNFRKTIQCIEKQYATEEKTVRISQLQTFRRDGIQKQECGKLLDVGGITKTLDFNVAVSDRDPESSYQDIEFSFDQCLSSDYDQRDGEGESIEVGLDSEIRWQPSL
ncbi:hypothetical protein K1719_013793 [Acacia pycnantha]|nr:hypothetical protein K1719_013793 [Acacia pycnantha]